MFILKFNLSWDIMAKLTKNRNSLQIIIPLDYCNSLGWKAGDEITLTQQHQGLLLEKKSIEPKVSSNVFTIGYEGKTMDKFLHELMIRNITQLIDVRELAYSRKPGFSKTSLKSYLESAGITYWHIPALGSPSDVRHTYKEGGSMAKFMQSYRSYLDTIPDAYDELKGFVLSKPSVLMCFEREHTSCHREILAERLLKDGFHITHI